MVALTKEKTLQPDVRVLSESPSWWSLSLVLAICSLLSFILIDRPVGEYFKADQVGGDLGDLLTAAEHFGTPWGQLLVLISIAAVAQWREPRVIRVFCGACAAGLSANVVKLCIARVRPKAFDFTDASLVDGFTAWFPLGAGGSAAQSFPSAHTASAFGFAALMTWLFPGGRWAFIGIALMTGMQRVSIATHFPSDVLMGGAVGWLVGMAFIRWEWLDNAFRRLEERPNQQRSASTD